MTQKSIDDALQRFSAAAQQAAQGIADMISSIAAILSETLNGLSFGDDERFAFVWACVNHPDWYQLMNHTKRKRIRKKYKDRIVREYKKVNCK